MAHSDLKADELRQIVGLYAAGQNAQQIGHVLKRDRRTITAALKRMGYEVRRGRRRNLEHVPSSTPPLNVPEELDSPVVLRGAAAEPPEVEEGGSRVGQARRRLWEVLMDLNSPGQSVVAAFNALAESEGWATKPPPPLPEAETETEIVDRWRDLFASYPLPLMERVLAALAGCRDAARPPPAAPRTAGRLRSATEPPLE